MTKCDICGRETHGLPYTCRRCGGHFCSDHRLPENHHCIGYPHFYTESYEKYSWQTKRKIVMAAIGILLVIIIGIALFILN